MAKFIIRQIPKVEVYESQSGKSVQPIYGQYLSTPDIFLISGVLK
jgi:hypothetical protein